jgi:hypothetical protein
VRQIFFKLLLFFPYHVLKCSNATLSGRVAVETLSKELKNFLLLLLSNNATEEELVGVQDNHDVDAELYRALIVFV